MHFKRVVFTLLMIVFLLSVITNVFCQTPPQKPLSPQQKYRIEEEKEEVSEEIEAAMEDILSSETDQQKVIRLRFLLKRRMMMVKNDAPEEAIERVDQQILDIMSTVDEETQEEIMEALDEIWDAEEDYYEVILEIYDDLDYYKVWLGPKYNYLIKQRVFYKTYYPKFIKWREKRPRRHWHSKNPYRKPPKYQRRKSIKKSSKPIIKKPVKTDATKPIKPDAIRPDKPDVEKPIKPDIQKPSDKDTKEPLKPDIQKPDKIDRPVEKIQKKPTARRGVRNR